MSMTGSLATPATLGGRAIGAQVPRRGTCKGACPGEADGTTPGRRFNDAFNDAAAGFQRRAPDRPNDGLPPDRKPRRSRHSGPATDRRAHDLDAARRATTIGCERRHGRRRRSTRPLLDHRPEPARGTAMTAAARADPLEWADAAATRPQHRGVRRSTARGRGPADALRRSSVANRTSPAAYRKVRVRRTGGPPPVSRTPRVRIGHKPGDGRPGGWLTAERLKAAGRSPATGAVPPRLRALLEATPTYSRSGRDKRQRSEAWFSQALLTSWS